MVLRIFKESLSSNVWRLIGKKLIFLDASQKCWFVCPNNFWMNDVDTFPNLKTNISHFFPKRHSSIVTICWISTTKEYKHFESLLGNFYSLGCVIPLFVGICYSIAAVVVPFLYFMAQSSFNFLSLLHKLHC